MKVQEGDLEMDKTAADNGALVLQLSQQQMTFATVALGAGWGSYRVTGASVAIHAGLEPHTSCANLRLASHIAYSVLG